MPKCPYCARPLSRGFRCRACRRYVLRPVHIVLLALAAVALVIVLLDLFARFI